MTNFSVDGIFFMTQFRLAHLITQKSSSRQDIVLRWKWIVLRRSRSLILSSLIMQMVEYSARSRMERDYSLVFLIAFI